MNLLQDIITYIRRIIKSPSNAQITDNLLIDYINRFWIMDVDARIQLFDLKQTYRFQTIPGIDKYNMPLYSVQTEQGSQNINFYPVYQGFLPPSKVNGIDVSFYTERNFFYDLWPSYIQNQAGAAIGNGGATYTINLPFFPTIPGHIDITGLISMGTNQDPPFVSILNLQVPTTSVYSCIYITATDANGNNIVVADSGQFLNVNTGGDLVGLLMSPGLAPFGNAALPGGYDLTTNTVNYNTGVIHVTFPVNIPAGTSINTQCIFIQPGLPRAILFENNTITLRNPPDKQYQVELDAYLSPAAFLNSSAAVQFGYMSEYLARGAARKILADTGDIEQFQFYEPLFKEQETLVWKRSQRQFTSTRTQTIFSTSGFQANYSQSSMGT